jgi:hypothetical protein
VSKTYAIGPSGTVLANTPEQEADIAAANLRGYESVSKEEAFGLAKADANKKYVDENWGTVGQAALGVADGLTLGLGPSLASRAGMLDRGHLEAAQQSGAFGVGEGLGFLAPMLLSGGSAAAGEGAVAAASKGVVGRALAASPAGLLGGAGGIAERAMARLIPEAGLLGKVGDGALKMAARGATEGALMNVAHQTSEGIIANKPLSAQALWASGVDGALFGGLIGGALGGAGGVLSRGVEFSAGTGSKLGSKSSDRTAGIALKRIGMDPAVSAATDGGTTGALRSIKDLMEKGETSFSAPTGAIRESMKRVSSELSDVASSALKELGTIRKPGIDPILNFTKAMDDEWRSVYSSRADSLEALRINKSVTRRFSRATSWEDWAANRQILQRDAAGAAEGSLKKQLYDSALVKFDTEFRAAGVAADESLFNKYASAASERALADAVVESTGKKLGMEANRGNPLMLNQSDGGALGIGAVLGNPLGAVGIVASRKVADYANSKLEPVIAEFAARSAIGSSAGAATARVGESLSAAVRKFVNGAERAVVNERAKSKASTGTRPSYTMEAYNSAMDAADIITSPSQRAKVEEHADSLASAGHPELGREVLATYNRAVSDIVSSRPKDVLRDRAMGSLGKTPRQSAIGSQGLSFLNRIHSIRDPLGMVIGGLNNGSLSRASMDVFKRVFPDLHSDLVARTTDVLMLMKRDGRHLPADKLVTLGILLGHPVDSKLNPKFIGAIQDSLASTAGGGAKNGPNSGPDSANSSSYITAVQRVSS